MANSTNRIIASVLSLIVIVLLVYTGPAQAFVVSLGISNASPLLGELISFSVSAQIQEGDNTNINNFTLVINNNSYCVFSISGEKLTSCNGINIVQIENLSYGYGYLLPGFLKYNITINSESLGVGNYNARLIASTIKGEFQTSESSFAISDEKPLYDCSVRGKGGEISLNEKSLGNNSRINFYVPLKSAREGEGEFTVQEGRKRVSYKFDVKKAVRRDSLIVFKVQGEVREDLNPFKAESAVITLDKNTKKINLDSSSLVIRNMPATLMIGC